MLVQGIEQTDGTQLQKNDGLTKERNSDKLFLTQRTRSRAFAAIALRHANKTVSVRVFVSVVVPLSQCRLCLHVRVCTFWRTAEGKNARIFVRLRALHTQIEIYMKRMR